MSTGEREAEDFCGYPFAGHCHAIDEISRLREEHVEARGKIAAEMARAEREADTLYAEGHAYASGKVDAYEFALAALAAASVPEGETK